MTFGWPVVTTYALLKLVGLFVPIRISIRQEFEAPAISQMAKHRSTFDI